MVERAAIDPSPGEGPGLALMGLRLDLRGTASDGDARVAESSLSCPSHKEELTHTCTCLAALHPPAPRPTSWIVLSTAKVHWTCFSY